MNPQNIIGKPIVVLIDGERRPIGTIVNAKLDGKGLFIHAKLSS